MGSYKCHCFLIGPRGSGKSTVGRALADILGWAFADTDALVVRQAGAEIARIVDEHGWEHFRQLESAALRGSAAPRTVVATGGGIILDPANRVFMRERGLVAYLCADAATLAARLAEQPEPGQRPSLTGAPLLDEIAAVVYARDALYRAAAHRVLDATLPVEDVARTLAQTLRQ